MFRGKDTSHLGIDQDSNQMLNLGQISYPKFSYDDRFTDIEIQRFNELFTYFDREANGTMDTRDLGLAMRSMGALVTDKEVDMLIKKYDPSKTGYIANTDF